LVPGKDKGLFYISGKEVYIKLWFGFWKVLVIMVGWLVVRYKTTGTFA
jgi:hypothetical protein